MHAPSTSISAMPKPRVVAAETPRRNPVHFGGAARIERDRVLVRRDPGAGERGLRLLAEDLDRREIEQHHVGVGAARDNPDAVFVDRAGERTRVLDHAPRVVLELRAKGFAQAHRLGGEDVGVKTALDTGEHGRLEALGEYVPSAPG